MKDHHSLGKRVLVTTLAGSLALSILTAPGSNPSALAAPAQTSTEANNSQTIQVGKAEWTNAETNESIATYGDTINVTISGVDPSLSFPYLAIKPYGGGGYTANDLKTADEVDYINGSIILNPEKIAAFNAAVKDNKDFTFTLKLPPRSDKSVVSYVLLSKPKKDGEEYSYRLTFDVDTSQKQANRITYAGVVANQDKNDPTVISYTGRLNFNLAKYSNADASSLPYKLYQGDTLITEGTMAIGGRGGKLVNGAGTATLDVPEKAMLAGQSYKVVIADGDEERNYNYTASGNLFWKPQEKENALPSLGTTGDFTGKFIPTGYTAQKITANGQDLHFDSVDGNTFKGITIPMDLNFIGPIVATYTGADGTPLTVTASVPVSTGPNFNKENIAVEKVEIETGLYQTAYSAKENRLYVTRSQGRTPSTAQSAIVMLDGQDLKELKSKAPAAIPDSLKDPNAKIVQTSFAVYGIGIDDVRGLVWVTNSRANTVAVYDMELNLLHQFPLGSANHPRDIQVDTKTGKAYASAVARGAGAEGAITVFSYGEDLGNGTATESIATPDSSKEGMTGYIYEQDTINTGAFSPMSVVIDQENQILYSCNLNGSEILKYDLTSTNPANRVTTWAGNPTLSAGAGIAYDPVHKELYLVGQKDPIVVVVDATTGEVKKTIQIGVTGLNAVYEPVKQRVIVTSREGGRAVFIDTNTKSFFASLDAGKNANHASVDGKGDVFVVNKANADGKDTLYKLTDNNPISEAPVETEGDDAQNKSTDTDTNADKDKDTDKKLEESSESPSKENFLSKILKWFKNNLLIVGIVSTLLALAGGAAHAVSAGLIQLPPM